MKKIEKLQYITQSTLLDELIVETQQVLSGGCRWIQLRMKESSREQLLEAAITLRGLCDKYGAILLINDNVEVCRDSGADGVHLGKGDISTLEARAIIGDDKIIGRTANSVDDIISLNDQKIDYIGLGPLRFTTTKKLLSPVIGLDGYAEILTKSQTKLPVVAVGGIVESDIAPLLQSGVYGVALSGVIFKAKNRAEITKKLSESL